MSQSGSFLSRALSQALQNEHKEKNIFLFINDLFLHDKIKVNSKIEMESMSEALGSSEEQKSIELE